MDVRMADHSISSVPCDHGTDVTHDDTIEVTMGRGHIASLKSA